MCRMKLIDGKRTQARVQRAVVVPHLQVLHRNVQAIKENSVFFLVFNSTWHYHIAYCHLFISIFSSSSFSSTPPYTLFYVINWRFDNKWRASKLLNSCNLISFAARRRRWNRKPKKKIANTFVFCRICQYMENIQRNRWEFTIGSILNLDHRSCASERWTVSSRFIICFQLNKYTYFFFKYNMM